MKRWIRRLLSGTMAAALLMTSVSAAELPVQTGLRLAESLKLAGTFVEYGQQVTREQVLTYSPGGDVQPMVVYGDHLYGRSTMDYIEAYLAEQNLTAVAAVNGAFFDFATGVPYGMVVTEGILRSSGSGNTVCIWEDGSISIEDPMAELQMIWNGKGINLNYNKAMTKENGYCLYSEDYGTTTKTGLAAYNLVLEPERAQILPSDSVRAVIREILPATAGCRIPEGCFILSLPNETVYQTAYEEIRQMQVGDTVTISAQVKRGSEKLVFAFGGGDLLVEDGRVNTAFTLDSAEKNAARTALGIKANGDVVCFAADKGDRSDGLTLEQLAARMVQLGCVKAINLDGGGSTTVGAALPGLKIFDTVNDPSDGKQRPCANFLFFVRPTVAAGKAERLHLYPYDAAVLRGGQVELTVAASDSNYMAAAVPADLTLTASGGTLLGKVFTAQQVGTASVTAAAAGMTATTSIHVVETPTDMTVRRQDQKKALDKLVVESGETVDLTVDAVYYGLPLKAQDYAFGWYVPPELGRVGDDGTFTASENIGEGDLMVTCGDLRVMVSVEIKANPFADTKGHWAGRYITELFYQGILQGSADAAGKMLYRPDTSMTRQEFVAAMMRAQELDLTAYTDTELPFADAAQIAPWAVDAVKAAYALGYFTGSGRGDDLYAQPTDTITREAAMTILARTISAQSDSAALDDFSDVKNVSPWAKPALTAMVEKEIINGINGQLQPQGNVTRAQVAKMLYAMQ